MVGGQKRVLFSFIPSFTLSCLRSFLGHGSQGRWLSHRHRMVFRSQLVSPLPFTLPHQSPILMGPVVRSQKLPWPQHLGQIVWWPNSLCSGRDIPLVKSKASPMAINLTNLNSPHLFKSILTQKWGRIIQLCSPGFYASTLTCGRMVIPPDRQCLRAFVSININKIHGKYLSTDTCHRYWVETELALRTRVHLLKTSHLSPQGEDSGEGTLWRTEGY